MRRLMHFRPGNRSKPWTQIWCHDGGYDITDQLDFASGPLALEEKLGPMLWQLPASFTFDAEVMRNFLDLLPDDTAAASDLAHRHDDKLKARGYLTSRTHRRIRHAVEPRHRSFDVPQFYELLEAATWLARSRTARPGRSSAR